MSCASTAGWKPGAIHRSSGRPPKALEIAGIVIGFIYVWPLALAYLIWKLSGYPMLDDMKAFFERNLGRKFETPFRAGASFGGGAGNLAFEEYRAGELKRLEEERRRLDEESRHFRISSKS